MEVVLVVVVGIAILATASITGDVATKDDSVVVAVV
jgi:hypothetical protein